MRAAFVCALLALAVCYALFMWLRITRGRPLPTRSYLICLVMPPCVFVFVIYHGQALLPWLRRRVFLDRLCVHQTDPILKRGGIEALGDVVHASERLLILLSEDYLSRLWCLFELATFTSSHHADSLDVMPLWWPPSFAKLSLIFAMTAVCWVLLGRLSLAFFSVLLRSFGSVLGTAVSWTMGMMMPSMFVSAALLQKVRWHVTSDERLKAFSLADARVTVEADRPIVLKEVRLLHGSEARFEQVIRDDMRKALRSALGPPGLLPYRYTLLITSPVLTWILKDVTAIPEECLALTMGCRVSDGSPYGLLEGTIDSVIFYGTMAVAMLPLAMIVCGRIAQYVLKGHTEATSTRRWLVAWVCCTSAYIAVVFTLMCATAYFSHRVLFPSVPCS